MQESRGLRFRSGPTHTDNYFCDPGQWAHFLVYKINITTLENKGALLWLSPSYQLYFLWNTAL